MQLVKDSLAHLMSMLKLCHILKHQDIPRPSEERQWHVSMTITFSVPAQSTTIWCGQGGAGYSQTKYINSLHKYLLKSLLATHGTAACIENYQLLLVQTLCIFNALCFLHCNKKSIFTKNIPVADV